MWFHNLNISQRQKILVHSGSSQLKKGETKKFEIASSCKIHKGAWMSDHKGGCLRQQGCGSAQHQPGTPSENGGLALSRSREYLPSAKFHADCPLQVWPSQVFFLPRLQMPCEENGNRIVLGLQDVGQHQAQNKHPNAPNWPNGMANVGGWRMPHWNTDRSHYTYTHPWDSIDHS